MESRQRVLVIDDGELARFRSFFKGSRVEVQHLRGDVRPEDLEGSFDLVIASVKRTLSLENAVHLDSLPGKPTWIAVHAQDFLPLRVRLQRMGVHFLVQSSVGTDALRLLIAHCMHRGPERREALRLPVGVAVQCRIVGCDAVEVELLDLTAKGCRIVTGQRVAVGASLAVDLPAKLAGGSRLTLPGRIQRAAPHRDGKQTLATVEFDALRPEATELLEAILQGKVIGTVVTRLGGQLADRSSDQGPEPNSAQRAVTTPPGAVERRPPAARAESPTPAQPEPEYPHTRVNRRSAYTRGVTALLAGGELVVLGRDLSIAGMRTDRRPELTVGTRLELAIYGSSGAEPVLVQAVVARDDGEQGTIFHFTDMAAWERPRLQAIVDAVPEIRSLAARGAGETVVLSRLSARPGKLPPRN